MTFTIFELQQCAAILIWIITVAGGFFALHLLQNLQKATCSHSPTQHRHFRHSLIHLAESFAGGVFLGAALFHMLPDAQIELKQVLIQFDYPFANLICAIGFCVLLFLETVTHYLGAQKKQPSRHLVPLLFTLLISIHAFSEGIALGTNQQIANVLIIFLAIAVHKSSEGFAVSLQLQKSTLKMNSVASLFFLFSLMSPFGILLGSLSHHLTGKNNGLWSGICNAFAAGTFLYLATLHKLHHAHEHPKLGELFFTLLGLSLMAIAAVWV